MPYIIDDEGVCVRPLVSRLACFMEDKLARHDADRGAEGWRSATVEGLLRKLREEYEELVEIACDEDAEVDDVWSEAADVANVAAMVADLVQCLVVARGARRSSARADAAYRSAVAEVLEGMD